MRRESGPVPLADPLAVAMERIMCRIDAASEREADGKYVDESVAVATFGFSAAELLDLATADPIVIRSKQVGDRLAYNWGDLVLVSAIATPYEKAGVDLL